MPFRYNNTTLFAQASNKSFQRHFYQPGQGAALLTFFVVAFTGNLCLISKLSKSNKSSNRLSNTRAFVLQLAFADLVASLFCLLLNGIWKVTGQFYPSEIFCKLFKYFQKFGLSATTFLIVAIGLDRCFAVIAPIKFHIQLRVIMKFMSISAWLLALIYSLPQVRKSSSSFRQNIRDSTCLEVGQLCYPAQKSRDIEPPWSNNGRFLMDSLRLT